MTPSTCPTCGREFVLPTGTGRPPRYCADCARYRRIDRPPRAPGELTVGEAAARYRLSAYWIRRHVPAPRTPAAVEAALAARGRYTLRDAARALGVSAQRAGQLLRQHGLGCAPEQVELLRQLRAGLVQSPQRTDRWEEPEDAEEARGDRD